MLRSTERILTTHAGSLPRPADVLELVEGRDQREVRAIPGADQRIEQAVAAVVRRQVELGLDVPSDGEMGRVGFAAYVTERLSGFDGEPRAMVPQQVERTLFPEFFEDMGALALPMGYPANTGPVEWRGPACIQRDIATFRAALGACGRQVEAFMPAVSPGQIWLNFQSDYYPSDEAFIFAVAEALRNEYRAIVEAGFVLQLDDPGLAMGWHLERFRDSTLEDYRKVVAQHVEAINLALEGIPPEAVRVHVCWGNSEFPHTRDVPLVEIVDVLYGLRAAGLYVEGANPRHGHEWRVFESRPLPSDKVLVAGVIDTLTNFVEHPDLVAERIARYASVVGRERFIAGTDCGFSTQARSRPRVHPSVAWAKLGALVEGAQRATGMLWA